MPEKLEIEISDIESILANFEKDHTEEEIRWFENRLNTLRLLQNDVSLMKSLLSDDGILTRQFTTDAEKEDLGHMTFPAGMPEYAVIWQMEQNFYTTIKPGR